MVFKAFTGSIFSVGTNLCVFFPAQVYLQKSNLSLSILQMRHLSIHNKDSGLSNAFTQENSSLFNSVEPWSRGAPFFRPLSHLVVQVCCPVFRWVRTISLQVAQNWSVRRRGGSRWRIAHPLNHFHSALLSLKQLFVHSSLQKVISFLVLLSVIPFPRPSLSGIPKMKNCP